MSLKVFHLVFVVVCVALALGFGCWAFGRYRRTDDAALLAAGILSIAGGGALVVYGRWFFQKLRDR